VATLSSLILDTAGSYTLSAGDGSLTNATSSPITINPAAASKLVFKQPPPLSPTAGQKFNVTVAVEDPFGNVVTGDSSTVSLASTPSGLTGTAKVSAVKGVATFSNLSFTKAGTYTLTASDGSLTNATSKPAVASKLVFQQSPLTQTAGQSFSVTVAVEDLYNNIVTTDGSTITLTMASGPGSFAPISVAAVKGVATFSNLHLYTAGSYTLSASNGSLTNVISSTITINAAAASKLDFTQPPLPLFPTTTDSVSLKVAVEDAFGNVVTGNSSTISLACNPTGMAGPTHASAVKGVATFSNLSFSKAGSYTLTFSDGSFTNATLNIFIRQGLAGILSVQR
jgi:S-adenosylmethionine hydrolase